ncbi:hypothetical protein EPO04_00030 [Patescibacteria group bacterium]|nr:MAG: hypothetical protein EPO04_00030 [Patescibacteria group bacterium]
MATHEARRKPERDASDFQGEGMPGWMREQLRRERFRQKSKKKQDAGPPVPPPIEDAILMAASDLRDFPMYPVIVDRSRHIVDFDWRKPEHWGATHQLGQSGIAAYLLYYMTTLSDREIADLIGVSAPTARKRREMIECDLARELKTDDKRTWWDWVEESMEKAQEIAECAILWLDGVEYPADWGASAQA